MKHQYNPRNPHIYQQTRHCLSSIVQGGPNGTVRLRLSEKEIRRINADYMRRISDHLEPPERLRAMDTIRNLLA